MSNNFVLTISQQAPSIESLKSLRSSLFDASHPSDEDIDYFNIDIKTPFSSIFEEMPPHPSSERFSVPTAPEGPTSRKPGGPNMNLDSNIGEGTSNRVGNNHRYTDTFEKLREFNRSNSNSKKLWRNPNQVTPLSQIPKNETIRTTSRNTEATNYQVFGVSSQDAKSLVLEPRDIEESFDMEIRRGNISDRYSK